MDVRRKAKILELENKTLRAKRENDQSTVKAKKDQLEERIRELEKESSNLHD